VENLLIQMLFQLITNVKVRSL